MHLHGKFHFADIINQLISGIAPYSGLILTIAACILAVIRLYLLDLIIPKVYSPQIIRSLSDGQRRSFINHHVAAGTKIVLLIITAYPFLAIFAGHKTPHTAFAKGTSTTLGDVMIVSSQIFTVMYIFELFYRDKVSPISCAHHVGAIIITQAAVAMSINFDHESDAVFEFLICFVWGTSCPCTVIPQTQTSDITITGAFDVLAELWPHITMIIYRIHNSNFLLLSRIFYMTMALELLGTIIETAIVMWLFGSLWDKWTLSLKIATPILHILFSAAQLWGAFIFYKMGKEMQSKYDKDNLVGAGES